MTTRQQRSASRPWGICPALGSCAPYVAAAVLLLIGMQVEAAFTEPRLALLRVSAHQSRAGSSTLTIEGSFSYADTVQLALPLNVVVTQGQLTARFDLAGHVFISTGGPEQPATGLGVISFAPREIVVVLPTGFSAGAAAVQVVANYEGKIISSNRLSFTL